MENKFKLTIGKNKNYLQSVLYGLLSIPMILILSIAWIMIIPFFVVFLIVLPVIGIFGLLKERE